MKTITKWQDMIVSTFVNPPTNNSPCPQQRRDSTTQFGPWPSDLVSKAPALTMTVLDGKQVLVAAGDRIFIYNAQNGEIIDSKRAHKDVVYCLAYSKDG